MTFLTASSSRYSTPARSQVQTANTSRTNLSTGSATESCKAGTCGCETCAIYYNDFKRSNPDRELPAGAICVRCTLRPAPRTSNSAVVSSSSSTTTSTGQAKKFKDLSFRQRLAVVMNAGL